jgi:eukaryotic-like serine/threonine-protein kinase
MSGRALTLDGTGFAAGDVILGKYRIERLLGKGGMGFVLEATHLGLEQPVAIKMLLPACATRVDIVARFSREARAAAKLKNEHVVRVTDVGALDGGAPYMVMEYLFGRDLETLIEERGTIPISDAVEYVLEACEALAEAHARGVVHRDLKPGNLFLAERPDGRQVIKLLDFGISKALAKTDDQEESLTGTDVLMGSPRYMAPEQLRSARDVDTRADIWSLGVILYQLIAGTLPFDAETAPKLIAQIAGEDPMPIERARPGVPPALARAIMRCLEKDLERRFATVRELAAAIALFANNSDVRARMERLDRAAATYEEEPEEIPEIEKIAMRVVATQSAFAEDLGPTLLRPQTPLEQKRSFVPYALVAFLLASIAATAAALWHAHKVQEEADRAAEAFVLRASPALVATPTTAATKVVEPVQKVKARKKKRRVRNQ